MRGSYSNQRHAWPASSPYLCGAGKARKQDGEPSDELDPHVPRPPDATMTVFHESDIVLKGLDADTTYILG